MNEPLPPLTVSDISQRLLSGLHQNGTLPILKSQLRSTLYHALHQLVSPVNPDLVQRETVLSWSESLIASLVADWLSHSQFHYTLSVFLPESQQQRVLEREELQETLEQILHWKEHDWKPFNKDKALLLQLVEAIKQLKKPMLMASSCQTDNETALPPFLPRTERIYSSSALLAERTSQEAALQAQKQMLTAEFMQQSQDLIQRYEQQLAAVKLAPSYHDSNEMNEIRLARMEMKNKENELKLLEKSIHQREDALAQEYHRKEQELKSHWNNSTNPNHNEAPLLQLIENERNSLNEQRKDLLQEQRRLQAEHEQQRQHFHLLQQQIETEKQQLLTELLALRPAVQQTRLQLVEQETLVKSLKEQLQETLKTHSVREENLSNSLLLHQQSSEKWRLSCTQLVTRCRLLQAKISSLQTQYDESQISQRELKREVADLRVLLHQAHVSLAEKGNEATKMIPLAKEILLPVQVPTDERLKIELDKNPLRRSLPSGVSSLGLELKNKTFPQHDAIAEIEKEMKLDVKIPERIETEEPILPLSPLKTVITAKALLNVPKEIPVDVMQGLPASMQQAAMAAYRGDPLEDALENKEKTEFMETKQKIEEPWIQNKTMEIRETTTLSEALNGITEKIGMIPFHKESANRKEWKEEAVMVTSNQLETRNQIETSIRKASSQIETLTQNQIEKRNQGAPSKVEIQYQKVTPNPTEIQNQKETINNGPSQEEAANQVEIQNEIKVGSISIQLESKTTEKELLENTKVNETKSSQESSLTESESVSSVHEEFDSSLSNTKSNVAPVEALPWWSLLNKSTEGTIEKDEEQSKNSESAVVEKDDKSNDNVENNNSQIAIAAPELDSYVQRVLQQRQQAQRQQPMIESHSESQIVIESEQVPNHELESLELDEATVPSEDISSSTSGGW